MLNSAKIESQGTWLFGDYINTDLIAPGLYMKSPIKTLAKHCLETVKPEFAANVRAGEVICAGKSFGMGSSREQAAEVLVYLGVKAVLAASFGGIFYRNAINHGLMALVCHQATRIPEGHSISIDPLAGAVYDHDDGSKYSCEPMPPHLLEMLLDGGLVAHLKKRFSEKVNYDY